MRSRGRESQVLDGYEVMWREVTGKVVFSRRLERAFDCIFGIKNKNQEILAELIVATAREIKNPFGGLSGITSPGLVRSQFRQEISQVARSTSPITGTRF